MSADTPKTYQFSTEVEHASEIMLKRSALLVASFLGLMALVSPPVHAGGLFDSSATHYRGSWVSETNGHHGLLKARVVPEQCGTYRVRFSGTYFGVVPFTYSVPMKVTGCYKDGSKALYGHAHLPIFGEFSCRARMNSHCFTARYSSPKDKGTFKMIRR